MWYTYVLKSEKDKNLYTGCTNNLVKRFEQHNVGGVFSTCHRKPLKLVYYEACLGKNDAFQREKYLKTFYGHMFLKNRLKSYFTGRERVNQ